MGRDVISAPLACFDCHLEKPETCALDAGEAAIYTARSPAKDTPNEDSLAVIPLRENSAVLMIADGLGGQPAGETAARIVISCLMRSIDKADREEIYLRTAILDGIEQANEEILGLKTGAATTLVVAEIQGSNLRTYHAGDSMIMLLGNRGRIKYSAIPHSPMGYALESGMIDESEARQHEERHLISNYIGSPEMRVEIGPNLTIAAKDTLILASDGLSDNLYAGEIVDIVRKGPLMPAAERLAAECLNCMTRPSQGRMGHPDDLSFVMFRPGRRNRR